MRRSGRAQKKVEKEEGSKDIKEKDANGNSKNKNSKKDEVPDKDSSGQQDSTSKNVRR